MSKEIELRLIDAPVPDDEIVVKDLAALTTALQELTTRIGREVINTPWPGRTKQFMEEFAQLRLRGIEAGSTVLVFSKGPTDKLHVDLPEQKTADDRFWEIARAIGEDHRPEWVTDLIAESAGKFVDALLAAAPKAVLRGPSRDDVAIESAHIHAETWTSKRLQTDTVMTAKGRLEEVDLRSHEFRVRDDVGQAVDLKHVEDDASVGQFVGQWVVARGAGILLSSGRLVALDNAAIEPVIDPVSSLPRAHRN
ncbi:MAG: hypothetical protein ACR2LE_01690 [Nocardioidaceae bacterium]